MKYFSGFFAAFVAISFVNAHLATLDDPASDLISVPVTEITSGLGYVVGVRSTKDGVNFCAGVLIGPWHVLTRTCCIPHNIRWVSIGSDSYTGDKDGEQIKVVALLVHPNNTGHRNDFLILELELRTTMEPVKLDHAKSIVTPGMIAARLGWNDTTVEAVQSRYLHSVEVQLVSNDVCSTEVAVDETNLCSRGVSATKSCAGDKGGAIVVKQEKYDVLVGIVSDSKGCGVTGGMSVYSRVAAVRPWIDSILKSYCVST